MLLQANTGSDLPFCTPVTVPLESFPALRSGRAETLYFRKSVNPDGFSKKPESLMIL